MKILIYILFFSSIFSQTDPPVPQIIHVVEALCDNENQSIVPAPAELGNGRDPKNNLYRGALYGLKTVLH